jgi:hypothetical protein
MMEDAITSSDDISEEAQRSIDIILFCRLLHVRGPAEVRRCFAEAGADVGCILCLIASSTQNWN